MPRSWRDSPRRDEPILRAPTRRLHMSPSGRVPSFPGHSPACSRWPPVRGQAKQTDLASGQPAYQGEGSHARLLVCRNPLLIYPLARHTSLSVRLSRQRSDGQGHPSRRLHPRLRSSYRPLRSLPGVHYFIAAGSRAIIVLTKAMVLTSEVFVSAMTSTCLTRAMVMTMEHDVCVAQPVSASSPRCCTGVS